MPRLRRATLSIESSQADSPRLQLRPVEASPRSLHDPDMFFRAILELERVRGLRVHPESATVH